MPEYAGFILQGSVALYLLWSVRQNTKDITGIRMNLINERKKALKKEAILKKIIEDKDLLIEKKYGR